MLPVSRTRHLKSCGPLFQYLITFSHGDRKEETGAIRGVQRSCTKCFTLKNYKDISKFKQTVNINSLKLSN